ncbi:TetR-like C-terminal domain-containing protein [Microbacterium sp. 2RAF4]|uniref:TetR-like C-terminal domain-containing protein n=1 Tax=Microbacterium sp. 2RAF4 TaxID=3232999 RepID=UPI003F947C83
MSTERGYHHGDLRAGLIAAAIAGLEAGEPFSLRGVARRAGVSTAAPYRHFPDRTALESAIAVEGFRSLSQELAEALARVTDSDSAADTIASLGVAYVTFALRNRAVFQLMFGNECDDEDSERVQASSEVRGALTRAIARLFPDADAGALAMAMWSMAHGLAVLHLDGKFRPEPAETVAERVRTAVAAVFAMNSTALRAAERTEFA